MTRQLPLPFVHQPAYDPAAFLADRSNAAALRWTDAPWPGGRLALWGEAGRGKTHLLHLWASRTGARLFAGSALPSVPPSGPLALDDASAAPEHALLHTLNAAAEEGRPVLLADRAPPSRWATRLPDLASRLRATTAVEMAAPDDDMLRTLLSRHLLARQLVVPQPVQEWLLLHLPREAAAMDEAAARLDGAALAAGRRVTQALASAVLAAF